jgi:hypothetical protein
MGWAVLCLSTFDSDGALPPDGPAPPRYCFCLAVSVVET